MPSLCAPGGAIAPVPRHTLQVCHACHTTDATIRPMPQHSNTQATCGWMCRPPFSHATPEYALQSTLSLCRVHTLYRAGQGAVPRHVDVVAQRVRRRRVRPLGAAPGEECILIRACLPPHMQASTDVPHAMPCHAMPRRPASPTSRRWSCGVPSRTRRRASSRTIRGRR